MRPPESLTPRIVTKAQMIRLRQRRFGSMSNSCPCDYCSFRPGRDMHELIPRSLTSTDESARLLSFQPEICSIVCPICHIETGVVTTKEGRDFLFRVNYGLYGYERVLSVFLTIPEQFRYGIALPERTGL